jgi:hypothetical protein
MARPTLMTHRKFSRLSRTLGDRVLARGVLEILWDGCYESGDDYLGTAVDIEQRCSWRGEPGSLVQALTACGQPEGQGFIEQVAEAGPEPTYRVHDLFQHAPDYVANRSSREHERRKEKKCVRCGRPYHASDPRSEYCSAACRTGGWRDRHSSHVRHGSSRQTHKPDDKTGRSNEHVTERDSRQRNGDGRVTDRDGTCAPAPAPALRTSTDVQAGRTSTASRSAPLLDAEPPLPVVPAPALLTFPTIGRGEATWSLTGVHVAEWSEAYPGFDVLGECRRALQWVRASPERRKTARGMVKFLVGWLNRSVQRGHPAPTGSNGTRPVSGMAAVANHNREMLARRGGS